MNKVLVQLRCNYEDEFDVTALWLTTKEEYKNFLDALKTRNIKEDTEIYFGTNECITFNSYDDIVNSLTCMNVSDGFYDEFLKNIGSTYGSIDIPDIITIIDNINPYR